MTDDFLIANSLPKGGMTLIDESKAKELYINSAASLEPSGGSAANTLACIAQLGGKCGFIGRVKDDELGEIFTEEISAPDQISWCQSLKE